MSSMSRKSFVKRVGVGSVALGAPPLIAGCESGGREEPVPMGEGFAEPSAEELEAIVAHLGFSMAPDEVASYGLLLAGFIQGAEALDAQSNLPQVRYPNRSPTRP